MKWEGLGGGGGGDLEEDGGGGGGGGGGAMEFVLQLCFGMGFWGHEHIYIRGTFLYPES